MRGRMSHSFYIMVNKSNLTDAEVRKYKEVFGLGVGLGKVCGYLKAENYHETGYPHKGLRHI